VSEGAAVPQEQEQKKVQKRGGGGDAAEEDAGQAQSTEKAEKLKDDMDEILDEIDSVLEENAEEFIKSYVQKGGE
jgi:ubiquitin-like protein Pup